MKTQFNFYAKGLFLLLGLMSILSSKANDLVIIPVETAHNALLLQTDADKRLLMTYFGAKLADRDDYKLISSQNNQADGNGAISNHAYTPAGTWNLLEPALTITHSDGNVSTELQYVSHTVQQTTPDIKIVSIILQDPVYKTTVELILKVYIDEDVIEQWSVITNHEKGPFTMQKYASANLSFIAKNYYLTHFHGAWAREMKPEQTMLTHGIKTIDSKLGTRANLFEHPVFMLSLDKPATENDGKVILGTLAWSGNFRMDFEVDPSHNLRVISGINPFQSEYPLATGKEFKTPSFIWTFSDKGIGEASRQLHRWACNYRILDGNGSRLTLLNNWEATYFDFDQEKLVALFADGKKLGVDLFLLDDGWFANKYPRNNDRAGLGDWKPNAKKLPDGISYLVKEAANAGIKFGIWVEPEMVNPKSELYETHPDWVIRQSERPEHYFRNQLVLDLSNPQVQDYVFGIMNNLLSKNPGIAFIKWDCNSVIFNAQSTYLQKTNQKQSQLYVDYVRGLYNVLERVRSAYPTVPMMLCSGGGGRVDYEALKYFTEYWPSDNTDPLERVFIQWNYSYFYPAIASCNHITDWSKVSLKYRTDVAMMGKMGYDIVVNNLSENELKFSQQALKTYDSFKDLVWHGDLHRLASPDENPYASLMFVNGDKSKAVVFNYVVSNRFDITLSPTPIKLIGLDPTKKYTVKEINLFPGKSSTLKNQTAFSGDFLIKNGFNPDLNQHRTSVVLEVTAE
ncbi:MAG: alpha-galactosidase [Bacteroidales bacterium]|nr:alpha-galactosidase [Bacteroidales bacterium]